MTPPSNARLQVDDSSLTWSALGKSILGLLVAWAAWEFRQMREAVYTSGTRIAVVETRVVNIEREIEKTQKRVENLETKQMDGAK